MRISELARETGVSVATVKFYLREGLLPAGQLTAATQADYGPAHVSRLRLIRALVDVGGLSLGAVRSVLADLDAGPDQLGEAIGRAHDSLGPAPHDGDPAPDRALAVLATLGWTVAPDAAAVRQLDAALRATEDVGIAPDPERLRVYAQAALDVARLDIATVPAPDGAGGAAAAVAYVVLGTVLYEPILTALRRIAQQQVFTGQAGQPQCAGDGGAPGGSVRT